MATAEIDLETWIDVKVHALGRCIDLAFTEPDPYMKEFFYRNLLLAKWMRAAILDGSREPYPTVK